VIGLPSSEDCRRVSSPAAQAATRVLALQRAANTARRKIFAHSFRASAALLWSARRGSARPNRTSSLVLVRCPEKRCLGTSIDWLAVSAEGTRVAIFELSRAQWLINSSASPAWHGGCWRSSPRASSSSS